MSRLPRGRIDDLAHPRECSRAPVARPLIFRARMKQSLLMVLGFLAVGCGGTDFTGTWTGDIERANVGTGTAVTLAEKWQINDRADRLDRTRGTETCTLTLETGTCSRGCFDKVVLAGQPCVIDGRTLVLLEGYLSEEGAGDGVADVSMSWAVTGTGAPEIIETGTLDQQ